MNPANSNKTNNADPETNPRLRFVFAPSSPFLRVIIYLTYLMLATTLVGGVTGRLVHPVSPRATTEKLRSSGHVSLGVHEAEFRRVPLGSLEHIVIGDLAEDINNEGIQDMLMLSFGANRTVRPLPEVPQFGTNGSRVNFMRSARCNYPAGFRWLSGNIGNSSVWWNGVDIFNGVEVRSRFFSPADCAFTGLNRHVKSRSLASVVKYHMDGILSSCESSVEISSLDYLSFWSIDALGSKPSSFIGAQCFLTGIEGCEALAGAIFHHSCPKQLCE